MSSKYQIDQRYDTSYCFRSQDALSLILKM